MSNIDSMLECLTLYHHMHVLARTMIPHWYYVADKKWSCHQYECRILDWLIHLHATC